MRRFLLAALLAIPWLVMDTSKSWAQCCCGGGCGCGGCYNLKGGFDVKICGAGFLKGCCDKYLPCICSPWCCGGGGCCNPCCCGTQCCCGGAPPTCPPGPWYLYWPLANYYSHPAPTGFPWYPPSMGVVSGSHAGNIPVPVPEQPVHYHTAGYQPQAAGYQYHTAGYQPQAAGYQYHTAGYQPQAAGYQMPNFHSYQAPAMLTGYYPQAAPSYWFGQ
ncbi:MAG: hypothetical protein ACK4RK_06300 [Gemmataceae bacterium]